VIDLERSEIKSEDWVLLTLKNTSERYGLDLSKWYQTERPDDFEINWNQFTELLDNMEKNGFIKRASSDEVNHCLTDLGKKKAMRLKKILNLEDYYFIISNFPEIELRERIAILESFVITSFILFLFVGLTKIPFSSYTSDLNILIAIISAFLFISVLVSYYFALNFIKILIFWIIGIQRDKLWAYKEWLWNNQNNILFPIPALFICVILYLNYRMDIVPWQSIVWSLALIFITYLLFNYTKVVKKLQSLFKKYLKL